MIKDVNEQLKNDKSSERKSSGILLEEATNLSDAADKIVWTKFGSKLNGEKENVSVMRIGR